MRRIKLTLEYDGRNFSGYQAQEGKRTIEGELEEALFNIYHERVATFASGRTDKGVHALGQVVHFDEPFLLKNPKTMEVINSQLPSDVKVVSLQQVGADFDARFNAKKKTYGYRFYLSKFERPLLFGRAIAVDDRADVSLIAEGAKYLIGEHDFKSFVARKSGKTNFVRTIYDAHIEKLSEGEYMLFVTGNGFLYNMIRIIMGTLILVGLKKIKPEEVRKIIDSKDRKNAGKTVAAEGLYLLKVDYD